LAALLKVRGKIDMNELSSLLSLTNKFYNVAPVETERAPGREKERRRVSKTKVKDALPELFAPGDIRKITKASQPAQPLSGAPFDEMRMAFWIKVSRIFSSKKKGS
jgi:hypothetical protein